MINGASCFSTSPTDKYVNFPAFGLKSIFTCSVLLTDITIECTQSNFEGIITFNRSIHLLRGSIILISERIEKKILLALIQSH